MIIMRLIDADELKEQFAWSEVCRLSIYEINKIIEDAPTIVIPLTRPQGEWKLITKGIDSNTYECPFCGRLINCDKPRLKLYPFCHCGADMRK